MSENSNNDWLIKLLIIGDSNVGKTNILIRFCDDRFHQTHISTIGIDMKLKTIEIDGKRIRMQIWDTAGQEKFKNITQTYYKGAMGIVLVYAINELETFQSIQNWMSSIKQNASEDICKILIGNKADITERQVSYEQGKQLADSYGIPFFETSAKKGFNVEEAFTKIATLIKDKLVKDNVQSFPMLKLQKQQNQAQQDQANCQC